MTISLGWLAGICGAVAFALGVSGRELLALFAFLTAVAALLSLALARGHQFEYVPAKRCPHCGYSLIDKENPKICTECGKNPNQLPRRFSR